MSRLDPRFGGRAAAKFAAPASGGSVRNSVIPRFSGKVCSPQKPPLPVEAILLVLTPVKLKPTPHVELHEQLPDRDPLVPRSLVEVHAVYLLKGVSSVFGVEERRVRFWTFQVCSKGRVQHTVQHSHAEHGAQS